MSTVAPSEIAAASQVDEPTGHRAVLAGLTPAERLRLTERSDRKGLGALAMHCGAIGLLTALIIARMPGWPLLMLPQGILVIFLFTLLHETCHMTVFRTPWLNTLTGRICGFVVVLPARWFRYFHLAHHRYTQDPANDPELASPKPETPGQYLWYISGLPIWWSHGKVLVRNALGRCDDAFVPTARHRMVRIEARVMILGYAALAGSSIALGSNVLIWVWVVPALLGQPFLRLYLLAEHGRCAFVADMFENTRTTFTNRLVRRLAWNMPYHAEHHAYPNVPFHQLPALHDHVRRHLKVTADGYTAFHREYVGGLDGG